MYKHRSAIRHERGAIYLLEWDSNHEYKSANTWVPWVQTQFSILTTDKMRVLSRDMLLMYGPYDLLH